MAHQDADAAALERSSERWLAWLHAELVRRGSTPGARLFALWDALEEWFAAEDFRGSFPVRAALQLRGEPGHPAHAVIAEHRRAVRALLEDLARAGGAGDPTRLAAQLHVVVEGAIVGAAIDRQPLVAHAARELAGLAVVAARADAAAVRRSR